MSRGEFEYRRISVSPWVKWCVFFFPVLFLVNCKETNPVSPPPSTVYIDSLNTLAKRMLKVDMDSADLMSKTNILIAEEHGTSEQLHKALNIRGRYYYETGVCDSAIYWFREGLSVASKAKDTIGIGRSFNNICTAYMCLGDNKTAIKFADSAYHIFTKRNMPGELAKTASNLAVNYIITEDYETAKKWLTDAIYHSEKSDDKGFLVRLYNNYGLFNRDFGDKDTGRYYLLKAIDLAREESFHVSLGTIFLNYGQDLETENPALCKAYLDSALTVARRNDLNDLEETTLGAIAICYRNLGLQVDTVGEAYERYTEKVIENHERYSSQQFAEFETVYKISEKNAENLALMHEVQERKRRQIFLVFLVIMVVLTSIFVIWSLYQSRRLAFSDRKIYQQQVDALLKSQEINNIDAMLQVQASERNRISAELHDRLGSILSAVKLNFSAMKDSLIKDDEKSQDQFEVLKKLIDDATSEVRRISHDMASGVLTKFGLMHAVYQLKEALEASGKIELNVYEHGMDARLSGNQEITLYRILQELISNALKHGNPKHIDIHFTKENGRVSLIVEDDGIGFNQEQLDKNKGIGLNNIRSRIADNNGKFTIDSNAKSGTTAIVEIPLVP